MEIMKNHRPVVRAVPRQSSRLTTISAALPVFTGVIALLLRAALQLRLFKSTRGGMLPELPALRVAPTVVVAVILILAGVLLFFAGKSHRRHLNVAASAVLLIAVRQFYLAFGISLLPVLAALLLVLSAAGWRYNLVPRFLPDRLAVPVMSLLAAALALFSAPAIIKAFDRVIKIETLIMSPKGSPLVSYLIGILVLLPLACVFFAGISSAATDGSGTPELSTKSVPQGGMMFTAAAAILLIGCAAELGRVLLSVYDMNAVFLRLPLIAAGVLLLMNRGREKRFLAAVICLLVGSLVLDSPVALTIIAKYRTNAFLVQALALVLMLLSSIGMLWNIAPKILAKITRAPVLNILAAALLLLSMALTTLGVAKHDAAVRSTRDDAAIFIAADFGDTVLAANKAKERADEALADFYEADAAYKAALADAAEFLTEEELASIEELNTDAAADIEDALATVVSIASRVTDKEIPNIISEFKEVSAEIVTAYEDAASGEPRRVTSREPVSGDTSSAPGKTSPASAMPSQSPAAPESSTPATANPSRPSYEAAEAPEDSQAPELSMYAAIDALNVAARSANRAESAVIPAIEAVEDAYNKVSLSGYSARKDIEKLETTAKESSSVWYLVALSLIPAAGLALLNLMLGNRQLERRGAADTFLQFCRRVVRRFYSNVGGKLQLLAKIHGVFCLVVAGLSVLLAAYGLCGYLSSHFFTAAGKSYPTLLLFTTTGARYGSLIILGCAGVLAALILALPTWLMYACGQITADVRELKERDSTAYLNAPENPDDLPEL